MAYRFQQGESVEAGFRRIADEQLGKIVGRLKRQRDGETTIHDARKSLKRLKALLKLLRQGISKKDYRREYETVRDAGRLLSGARDFEVMPDTLASLAAVSEGLDQAAVREVDTALERAKQDFEQGWDRNQAVDEAVEELSASRKRFRKIAVTDDFAIVAKGAGKCLAVLRSQGAHALASGHDEDFHEWRKSAQLHWRHLKLLTGVWPELMTARLTMTRALADVLGHDHDLAVLRHFIDQIPDAELEASGRRSLEDGIKARQHELRREARAYSGLLIIDKPSGFSERLCAYRAAQVKIAALDERRAQIQPDEGGE